MDRSPRLPVYPPLYFSGFYRFTFRVLETLRSITRVREFLL